MVTTDELTFWRPEYDGDVMTTDEVVKHLAYVKRMTGDSWKDIGETLSMKKGRAAEIMRMPNTNLEYPYRVAITEKAVGMYPGGIPMVKVYTYPAVDPEKNRTAAFGPQSSLAQQQALIPRPVPLVITPDLIGISTEELEDLIPSDLDGEELGSFCLALAQEVVHYRKDAERRKKLALGVGIGAYLGDEPTVEELNQDIERLLELRTRDQQAIEGLKQSLEETRKSLWAVSSQNAVNYKDLGEVRRAMDRLLEEMRILRGELNAAQAALDEARAYRGKVSSTLRSLNALILEDAYALAAEEGEDDIRLDE